MVKHTIGMLSLKLPVTSYLFGVQPTLCYHFFVFLTFTLSFFVCFLFGKAIRGGSLAGMASRARCKQFSWTDHDVLALVEKVAETGKEWAHLSKTASASNNYHGMSEECVKFDRMKEKWATIKRHPNALLQKSRYHYDLFMHIEDNSAKGVATTTVEKKSTHVQQHGNFVSPLNTMVAVAPIMPDEPLVRRIPHPPYSRAALRKNPYKNKKKKTKKNNYPPASVVIVAKYKSKDGSFCRVCRKPILVGQKIHNSGSSEKAEWTHSACEIVD